MGYRGLSFGYLGGSNCSKGKKGEDLGRKFFLGDGTINSGKDLAQKLWDRSFGEKTAFSFYLDFSCS